MTNRQVLSGVSLLLALVGAVLVYEGLKLRYYTPLGPGPGFFPIWLGGALCALTVVLLFQTLRTRDDKTAFFTDVDAARNVVLAVLTFAAFFVALNLIGFALSAFAFAMVAPRLLERQRLALTLLVALLASFGVALLFQKGLRVQLPGPTIEFLQGLGL